MSVRHAQTGIPYPGVLASISLQTHVELRARYAQHDRLGSCPIVLGWYCEARLRRFPEAGAQTRRTVATAVSVARIASEKSVDGLQQKS